MQVTCHLQNHQSITISDELKKSKLNLREKLVIGRLVMLLSLKSKVTMEYFFYI